VVNSGTKCSGSKREILLALWRWTCRQETSRMDGYGPASPTPLTDQEDRLVTF